MNIDDLLLTLTPEQGRKVLEQLRQEPPRNPQDLTTVKLHTNPRWSLTGPERWRAAQASLIELLESVDKETADWWDGWVAEFDVVRDASLPDFDAFAVVLTLTKLSVSTNPDKRVLYFKLTPTKGDVDGRTKET